MMKVGVGNAWRQRHHIDVDSAHEQSAIVVYPKTIAPGIITKQDPSSAVKVSRGRAGPLGPSLDGEVLQLQAGRVADPHLIAIPIEDKTLTHAARAKGRIARQCAVVRAGLIRGITFSRPPTD